jgi:hypothetical protein
LITLRTRLGFSSGEEKFLKSVCGLGTLWLDNSKPRTPPEGRTLPITEISEITQALTKFRDERNWREFHNSKDLALALAIEA